MTMGRTFGLALSCLFIMCWSKGFAQWIQTNGPYGGNITCIAANSTTILAGTDGGGIFRSTDNGTSWTAASEGLTNTRITAIAFDGSNLLAGTTGNYHAGIFVSTNDGANWSPAGTGLPDKNITGIVVDDSDVFAGGTNGLFLSTDRGKN